ncbi:S-adenosylmethionine:tRNA ribosyltransferase-isomerase [Acidothermaceae bacterium B102]|nr:S-adenosylmethionine:tRNA ribosyltransferase-isomerase [Acidothermaceae bacterium B102]
MTAGTLAAPYTRFVVPDNAVATGTPESRGLTRDGVRLLLAQPGCVTHQAFRDLPSILRPGDVLVVNTSATLAAAVDGVRGGGRLQPVHVSAELDDGTWVVEVRRADGSGPALDAEHDEIVVLPGDLRLRLLSPMLGSRRLWRAVPLAAVDRIDYLSRFGRPISYDYLERRFPLADYQNVYATEPGSAEMASAGRPFTAELLVRLMAAGVTIAPVTLHCGVSSPELHEPPMPEQYDVPVDTARLVNSAVWAGRRVVAVGTTVVRALETVATDNGTIRPGRGWTDLVLGPGSPARVVTGLFTGLHVPEASHLLLLEAVAGPELVQAAYEAAVPEGYLWHEFGDSMLFLPGLTAT